MTEGLILVGFLTALVAHFVETHFVFSFSATHLYFWVYAGSIVAVSKRGLVPLASRFEDETQQCYSRPPNSRGNRIHEGAVAASGAEADGFSGALRLSETTGSLQAFSGLLGIVLVVLAFDFLLPSIPLSFGVFIIIVLTWTFGLILKVFEASRGLGNGEQSLARAILVYTLVTVVGFSFFVIVVRFGMFHLSPLLIEERVGRSAAQSAEITAFFGIYLLFMLVFLAFALGRPWKQHLLVSHAWKVGLYVPATLLTGFLIFAEDFNEVRGDIYLKRAQSALRRQEWDQAIGLIRAARRVVPDEDQYCLMLANAYQNQAADRRLSTHERKEAAEYGARFARIALELNPYNPDHYVNLGRYFFSLGPTHYEKALEFAEKATLLAPGRVGFRFLLAQIHFKSGDYEEAIAELRKCNSIDHKYPLAWLLLGDVYLKLDKVDQALDAHSRGMSLRVRRLDGFTSFSDAGLDGRLNAYSKAGRLEELLIALQRIAAERPQEGAIPWVIGRGFYLNGQVDRAVQKYHKAIPLLEAEQRSSSRPLVLERLAHAYIVTGKTRAGIDLFCRLRGDSCETKLFELGVELVSKQLYFQASEAFAKVVELNEKNASAHKNLGVMYYYHLDRREEGLRHFRRVLELQPNRSDAEEIRQLLKVQ
jgi:tetratricopeptide (TPR) repeat protein